jgi:hypothetical protein
VRKEIEYGFWGMLLVSETATTITEYIGRVSHLLRLAKTVMIGPEGETPNGRGSDKVSAVSE